MLKLTRYAVALLAGFALVGPAVAQTPAQVQGPAPRGANAPAMPAPTSSTLPARMGAPVGVEKRIDVNAASETELATLPGIGPVTAKAIVDGRPWDDLAALQSKRVLSQPVFERNKDRLALANINSSSAADMAKTLPGIGDKLAPKIVNGRPYATPQDLVSKKVLTAAQFAKVKGTITY